MATLVKNGNQQAFSQFVDKRNLNQNLQPNAKVTVDCNQNLQPNTKVTVDCNQNFQRHRK